MRDASPVMLALPAFLFGFRQERGFQGEGVFRTGSNETVRNPEFPEEEGGEREVFILQKSLKRGKFREVTASFEMGGKNCRASDP